MTTTTTLPAGITAYDEPCWHLVGGSVGAGEQHFDSEANAAEHALDLKESYLPGEAPTVELVPTRLDAPCWTATAACGAVLDGDEFAVSHFLTGADALTDAMYADWNVVDGLLWCDAHDPCQADPETA